MASGWVVSEFVKLRRRHQREEFPATIDSSRQNGARTWELRLGSSPSANHGPEENSEELRFQFSKDWTVPLTSIAGAMLPTKETLDRLEVDVECGRDLAEAIRDIEPAYDQWSTLQQQAYCLVVRELLEQRQATT